MSGRALDLKGSTQIMRRYLYLLGASPCSAFWPGLAMPYSIRPC
jgi:hypothetical protein